MATPGSNTPALPLGVLVVLALGTLFAAGLARTTGIGAARLDDSSPVTQRDLRFDDRPDGGIDVEDARSGAVIGSVAPGTNGFLRSAVRGLVRERKREGIGPELPFALVVRSDGRLTLEDPGTHRRIDLRSFGATNAGVFEALLAARPAAASH